MNESGTPETVIAIIAIIKIMMTALMIYGGFRIIEPLVETIIKRFRK